MNRPPYLRLFLRITLAALGVVLLIVLVTLGLFLLLNLFRDYGTAHFDEDAIVPLLMIVGIVTGLVILAAFVLAIYLLFRLAWRNLHTFGVDPRGRLVALGLAAFLFPAAIWAVLRDPVQFLADLGPGLAGAIREAMPLAPDTYGYTLSEVARQVFELLAQMAEVTAAHVNGLLSGLPLRDLVLALAIWALAGWLLSGASEHTDASGPGARSRLGALWGGLSLAFKRRFLLSTVFLVGAFLSVAAIVAIPWLEERGSPEDLSRDRLEQRLDEIAFQQSEFDQRFPPDPVIENGAVDTLRARLSALQDSFSTPPTPAGPYLNDVRVTIRTFREEADRLEGDLAKGIDEWQELREEVLRLQRQMRQSAVASYGVDLLSPMTTEERAYHFRQNERWYRTNVNRLYVALDQARRALEIQASWFDAWATSVLQGGRRELQNLKRQRQDSTFSWLPNFNWGFEAQVLRPGVFSLPEGLTFQPDPPDPGLGWGPFGWISRWLLRTRSFPLTLITGMMGFGLFGSAIAAFVRQETAAGEDTESEPAFAGILVRGVSAAVVIFLAVKGGVAAFASGGGEPDPYVLFFACLLAAVFSEHVWDWAHRRFLGALGNGGKRRTGAERP